jgi:hypothetical protein
VGKILYGQLEQYPVQDHLMFMQTNGFEYDNGLSTDQTDIPAKHFAKNNIGKIIFID